MSIDPYVDPASGMLRNRLGISDPQRRRVVEAGLTLAALADLGTRTSDPFCLPQHIEAYSAEVFGALAKERYLRGLPRDAFIERLTHYFAEVNAIHPFREGNGRTQRAFFRQLSREAGWPIDWSDLDPDSNEAASMASLRGDNDPLRRLLSTLVVR